MIAVGLACLSAALFGGMSVALAIALRRSTDTGLGTVATVGVAFVVAAVWAAAEVPARGVHANAAWPFALAGLLSPGAAQLLVTLGIREAGASRVSMVFGTAPLVSVSIALVILGEPLSVPLLVGAVLVVAGAVELARERDRPAHLRRIGLVYSFVGVILFATRDNLVRWLSGSTAAPPAVAASAALLGGGLLAAAVVRPALGRASLQAALPFVPAGLCFGSSYVALFEAYYRDRVTVVSPLIATESLWGVALSILLIRRTELVGRRLVLGALLIVGGGAIIGATR
jgi:drug/metabolite transporter (DMT)-like permease